jgi:hypothetical protein
VATKHGLIRANSAKCCIYLIFKDHLLNFTLQLTQVVFAQTNFLFSFTFNFDLNFIGFKLFIMTNVLIVNLTIIKNSIIAINYFRLYLILIKIYFVL